MSRKHPKHPSGLPLPRVNPWWETLPEWIVQGIVEERAGGDPTLLEKASDLEVLAVLYQLSLAAPLRVEYARIFMHIAQKILQRPPFPDERVELTDYERELLEELRRDIREATLRAWRRGARSSPGKTPRTASAGIPSVFPG